MRFNVNTLEILIDDVSGSTLEFCSTEDGHHVNYILPQTVWGAADGFAFESAEVCEDHAQIIYKNNREHLTLTVCKYIQNDRYYESYTLTNQWEMDYYLTCDSFGIQFPFNCYYKRGTEVYENNCISHIWCGGHTAYIKSEKPSGHGKKLWMTLVEGCVADYSIYYPENYPVTAEFRGIPVLHCDERVIRPGESICNTFAFYFDDRDDPENVVMLKADKYSAFEGEEIHITVTGIREEDGATVYDETGRSIPLRYDRQASAAGTVVFQDLGEHRLTVEVRGRKTFALFQVIRPIREVLLKRASFIADRQQCIDPGSHLDGALLIYDRETDRKYYSRSFVDSNAGRERLSMGVILACALQEQYDEKIFVALKRHRAFVERELFDCATFTVYDDAGRKVNERLYNYPWMSTYYFEWYRLTGEKQCLENAAGILLRQYEELNGTEYEVVCMEAYRILNALQETGEEELYDRLYRAFVAHADSIIRRAGRAISHEVTCANGMVSAMVEYLSQVYLLTKETKYLKAAREIFKSADTFVGDQPDYRLNSIAVRNWDGFWFGKSKLFGDTFPQWLSSLSGLMYEWYGRATGEDYSGRIENNLRGAMCLYQEDGFAASCYFYPYRIRIEDNNQFSEKGWYVPGTFRGKRFDSWANDQDWALYYAWLLGGKILNT